MQINNMSNAPVSIQVSHMGDITSGADFKLNSGFLVKNTSSSQVTITGVTLGGDEITTPLNSGWNPEIFKEIKNAPANLQFGY